MCGEAAVPVVEPDGSGASNTSAAQEKPLREPWHWISEQRVSRYSGSGCPSMGSWPSTLAGRQKRKTYTQRLLSPAALERSETAEPKHTNIHTYAYEYISMNVKHIHTRKQRYKYKNAREQCVL